MKGIRELIIRPALRSIGLWSQAAENLLVLTAYGASLSSDSEYGPLGKGDYDEGLGLYRVLPTDYQSLIRYLNKYENRSLKEKCLSACFYVAFPNEDALIHNLRWASIMVFILYQSVYKKLPASEDVDQLIGHYQAYYRKIEDPNVAKIKMLYQG